MVFSDEVIARIAWSDGGSAGKNDSMREEQAARPEAASSCGSRLAGVHHRFA
jgi:hypothetical protein